ncbi:MAG: response regulator [Myxococcota bacterium]
MATVLVVEDEASLRETLSRYLKHVGYDVISAASGYEALEAGFAAEPDVLVADWMLKNHIHGLHVSEVFRALHPKLSTILITGFPSRDLIEESDRCGVSRLLEKPFDLRDLHDALEHALADDEEVKRSSASTIAAMAVGPAGEIQFASDSAVAFFEEAGLARDTPTVEAAIGENADLVLTGAESDWIEVTPLGTPSESWFLRSRPRPEGAGWLVAICTREQQQNRNDPRLRILFDDQRAVSTRTLSDHGPVVVIERDGVVRRLLVSQIERVGAICYASDDLQSGLKLLEAEPRVQTVLVDFTLAGADMAGWVSAIREIQPKMKIIGTGGVGSENSLLEQGVSRVLRKPWRINDLLDAFELAPAAAH